MLALVDERPDWAQIQVEARADAAELVDLRWRNGDQQAAAGLMSSTTRGSAQLSG
jgi:hypothetical protein